MVIENGTIRKSGCDFLFAFHSNYGLSPFDNARIDRPTSRDSTRPRLCIASRGKKIVVRGTAGIPNPELEHFDI